MVCTAVLVGLQRAVQQVLEHVGFRLHAEGELQLGNTVFYCKRRVSGLGIAELKCNPSSRTVHTDSRDTLNCLHYEQCVHTIVARIQTDQCTGTPDIFSQKWIRPDP